MLSRTSIPSIPIHYINIWAGVNFLGGRTVYLGVGGGEGQFSRGSGVGSFLGDSFLGGQFSRGQFSGAIFLWGSSFHDTSLHIYAESHTAKRFVRVCLFVLRFYGLVIPMGLCRARSVDLTTRLLGRLSPLSG